MGICGSDSDEKDKKPEDDDKEKFQFKTPMEKWIERIKGVVMGAIAIYTIVSLFVLLAEIQREELQLTPEAPSDRCVPFFDTVTAFVGNHSDTTDALYDFMVDGTAVVRLCTDLSEDFVAQKIGKDTLYDPFIDAGCDVRTNAEHRESFKLNCDIETEHAGASQNCVDILGWPPSALGGVGGVHWNHWVEKPDPLSNVTRPNGLTAARGECGLVVHRLTGIGNCTRARVFAARTFNGAINAVVIASCVVPFTVMFIQAYMLYLYTRERPETGERAWTADKGSYLACANRGVPGSFYLFYWLYNEPSIVVDEDTGKLSTMSLDDDIDGRGEFPTVYLSPATWALVAAQDLVEGLLSPLVAMLGCFMPRYPVNFVLLIVKGIKFLYDAGSFWHSWCTSKENEPGSLDEQLAALGKTRADLGLPMTNTDDNGNPIPGALPPPPQPPMQMSPMQMSPMQQQMSPHQIYVASAASEETPGGGGGGLPTDAV